MARASASAPADPAKERITIRLDADTLTWFRKHAKATHGGNYQTMINEALRAFVENRSENLEKTLRRVIREELRRKP